MIHFIFCHGFGMDPTFWDPLLPFFKNFKYNVLNLSYFCENKIPYLEQFERDASTQYIGIGHSYGFQKLLSLPVKWEALIGIQGFVHFLGFEASLQKKRLREYQLFKNQFLADPRKTLASFHKKCGFVLNENFINLPALQKDLESMQHPVPLPDAPTLIIGSDEDPITPKELLEDNFLDKKNIQLQFLANETHGVSRHSTIEMANHILNFCNEKFHSSNLS